MTIFKGMWFCTNKGIRTHTQSEISDVDHKSRLKLEDLFILATKARQVVYIPYLSK